MLSLFNRCRLVPCQIQVGVNHTVIFFFSDNGGMSAANFWDPGRVIDEDELRTGERRDTRMPLSTWGGRFQALDRALHLYERRPLPGLRSRSLRLCAEWIVRRQEADGCWGGIQPPWVYSLMALHLEGFPLHHPVIRTGLAGLEGFAIREGGRTVGAGTVTEIIE